MGLEGVVECKKMTSFNDLGLGGTHPLSKLGEGSLAASGITMVKEEGAQALPDVTMDIDASCTAQLSILLQVSFLHWS